jgi:hypothetical protein
MGKANARLGPRSVFVIAFAVAAFAFPEDVHPCGAIDSEVHILIPPASTGASPRNAVLLAKIVAPHDEPTVVLRSAGGDEIPIESEMQIDPSNSVGLLRARPVAPLEANETYAWEIDGEWHRELTTNAEIDQTPPSYMELVVVAAREHEVVDGCGDPATVVEHEVEVVGVTEEVAIMREQRWKDEWSFRDAASGTRLRLSNAGPEARCDRIFIEDHAGHVVFVAEHCVPAPDGLPEPDPPGGDGDDGQASDDDALNDRGCSCTSAKERSSLAWFAGWMFCVVAISRRRSVDGRVR